MSDDKVTKLRAGEWAECLKSLGLWDDWVQDWAQHRGASNDPAHSWTSRVRAWIDERAEVLDWLTRQYGEFGMRVWGKPELVIQPRVMAALEAANQGCVDAVMALVSKLGAENRAAYDRLLAAAKGKSASKGRISDWAFEHRPVPWTEIDPEDVPSRGAVGMLLQLKFDDGLYADLLKKRAPTTAQLQKEQEEEGDSGDLTDLLDRCLAEAKG